MTQHAYADLTPWPGDAPTDAEVQRRRSMWTAAAIADTMFNSPERCRGTWHKSPNLQPEIITGCYLGIAAQVALDDSGVKYRFQTMTFSQTDSDARPLIALCPEKDEPTGHFLYLESIKAYYRIDDSALDRLMRASDADASVGEMNNIMMASPITR